MHNCGTFNRGEFKIKFNEMQKNWETDNRLEFWILTDDEDSDIQD